MIRLPPSKNCVPETNNTEPVGHNRLKETEAASPPGSPIGLSPGWKVALIVWLAGFGGLLGYEMFDFVWKFTKSLF